MKRNSHVFIHLHSKNKKKCIKKGKLILYFATLWRVLMHCMLEILKINQLIMV